MEDIQDIAVIGVLRAFPQADHYNPFEALPDAKFFESFRFTKRACVVVLREVLPHLPRRVSRAGGVQPFMRVLFAMYYLATGNYYWCVGRGMQSSNASAWRYIKNGLTALTSYAVVQRWIPWYSPVDAQLMERRFRAHRQLPMVIGAVDGKQIPVLSPAEHEEAYINRKGYSSINIMCICDLDGIFRYVDAR
ncbi:hypothetical protein FOZ62_003376 [Perkinsus olseni]|uniref:DDE Tnp4 domain-containing protein n=1 Tax=Perkinsus olseni TaxID=32597 RepID=A0A7J6Q4S4_PEROL|nr:hypothetical protein FOZ62_003376 [Perkinsus olseni]